MADFGDFLLLGKDRLENASSMLHEKIARVNQLQPQDHAKPSTSFQLRENKMSSESGFLGRIDIFDEYVFHSQN